MVNSETKFNTSFAITTMLAMFYVTSKITCDPLFFKHVGITIPYLNLQFKVTGSTIIYPLTYVICDLLSLECNQALLIVIILAGALCDGVFSFLTNSMTYLEHPVFMSKSELYADQIISFLGPKMWTLFYHGVIGSIVATILEVSFFRILNNKIKNVMLSTFFSVSTLLVVHNLISNYPVMRHEPDGLRVVVSSTSAELLFLLFYIFIVGVLIKNKHFYNSVKYLGNTIYSHLPNKNKSKYDIRKAVHDIKSPITVIDNVIENIKNLEPSSKHISELKLAIENIRHISQNILNNTPSKSSLGHHIDTKKCFCHPSGMIENIIITKKYEWKANPCEILYHPVNAEKIWLYLIPNDFQVMLSNLLNNAYEARYTDSKILINLVNIDKKIIIAITDYGVGIPSNKISDVLNGMPLKPNGSGIGLSSAVEYVRSLGGELTLTSSKIEGTTVTIILPEPQLPKWLPSEIYIKSSQEVVICDDDPSVCNFWQDFFVMNHIKGKYFLNSKDFTRYVKSTNTDNLLVFMDYELGDKNTNGLNLLKQLNIKNAYLITSYAEHSWLQKLIADTACYYLLPKTLSSRIPVKIID